MTANDALVYALVRDGRGKKRGVHAYVKFPISVDNQLFFQKTTEEVKAFYVQLAHFRGHKCFTEK